MTEKEYELDNAYYSSNDSDDFLSFLDEREKSAQWIEASVKDLIIVSDPTLMVSNVLSEDAKNESVYTVAIPNEVYALRDIAIPSLLERARISGYALTELSHENFSDIVTKCLNTSKDTENTMLRLQDGKVGAFCASTYKVLPQCDVFTTAGNEISDQFDGSFVGGSYSHKLSLAEYTAYGPTSGYMNLFRSKGLNLSDVDMTLKIVTSDTGYSGLNIYPSITGITSEGKRLRIPILGEIAMPHKGSASIKKFTENIALSFAQAEKSQERITELDDIPLNYPFNTFCNVLKKVGVGKKLASKVLDCFAVTVGNKGNATAADLYFRACEIAFDVDEGNSIALMSLEENLSKMLKLSDKAWSEFDRPVNCWSFSIEEV